MIEIGIMINLMISGYHRVEILKCNFIKFTVGLKLTLNPKIHLILI